MNMKLRFALFAAHIVFPVVAVASIGSAHATEVAIPAIERDCMAVASQGLGDYAQMRPVVTSFRPARMGDPVGCAVEYKSDEGWIYAQGDADNGIGAAQIEETRRASFIPPAPALKKPVKKVAAKTVAPARKQAAAKPQAAPAPAAAATPVATGPKPMRTTRVVETNPVKPVQNVSDPRFDSAFSTSTPK